MALEDVFRTLDNLGFTDVFLPFILIYTIIFAILQKIKVFGDSSRKFNAIISLAMAIGVIIPHSLGKYPPGTDIVEILNTALPNISLLIVAIIFVLIIIGMFGGKQEWGDTLIGGIVTLIALGLIVFIFGDAAGWWESSGLAWFLSDPNTQATLLILAVFWMIIATITGKEGGELSGPERIGAFFGKALEKASKGPEEKK